MWKIDDPAMPLMQRRQRSEIAGLTHFLDGQRLRYSFDVLFDGDKLINDPIWLHSPTLFQIHHLNSADGLWPPMLGHLRVQDNGQIDFIVAGVSGLRYGRGKEPFIEFGRYKNIQYRTYYHVDCDLVLGSQGSAIIKIDDKQICEFHGLFGYGTPADTYYAKMGIYRGPNYNPKNGTNFQQDNSATFRNVRFELQ